MDNPFDPATQEIFKKVMGKDASKTNKDDDNKEYISFLETKDYILEEIKVTGVTELTDLGSDGTLVKFVKFFKATGEVEEVESQEYQGKVYYPIIDDAVRKNGIHLSTGVKEYKNLAEITDQIREFLIQNFEVPEFYKEFLPHLATFYWVYEKFPFIPYIHFVGGTSTGKTTAMEAFGEVCYRGIDTTGSLTVSSLFRLATSWGGTMIIDEFDNLGEQAGEIITFLKAGSSNRLIWRTEGDKKREVMGYIVKSPKLFTSEKPITDPALQSRTMVVQMEKNKRDIPLYRLDDFYQEAQEIRNKLLLWRLRNFNKIDLKSIRYGFPELKFLDRRVQQIVTPTYYLSDDETKKRIIEFSKKQEEETLLERRESLNGVIFTRIMEIRGKGHDVQIKVLTSLVNEDSFANGYKEPLTEKKVSNIVRKILGFNTEKRGDEKLAWIVPDLAREANWCKYFGMVPPEESSVNTVTPVEDDMIAEAERIFVTND